MSSTTADGAEVLAMDKASHPSLAWRTSKPSRLSIATAVSRRSSSSSTIRTRGTEAGLSPANPCLPRDATDAVGTPRKPIPAVHPERIRLPKDQEDGGGRAAGVRAEGGQSGRNTGTIDAAVSTAESSTVRA